MANPEPLTSAAWPARLAAGSTFFIGLGSLLGSVWEIDRLTNAGADLPRIVPSAAVCLMLSGIALWILGTSRGRVAAACGYAAGLSIAVFGGLALSEHLFGYRLAIHSLAWTGTEQTTTTVHPSFLTALNFLFYGVALLFIDVRQRSGRWALDLLLVLPMVISLLALIGYVCNVPAFYGRTSLFQNTAMSLPTACAFAVFGAGILCARPEQGLTKLIRSGTAGGVVARRLLLAPILIPLVTGIATVASVKAGLYNAEFAGWLISFLNIFIFTVVIWGIAALLDREGAIRDAAERQVREANVQLEQRVNARTAELREIADKAQWLASFPERNPNPIIEASLADGTIHYMNPFASRLFPDLPELGLKHPWLEGLQQYVAALHADSNAAVRREVAIGSVSYAQTITYNPERHLMRIYATEITERIRAEEALTRERNLLRILIDHLPACIYVKDPQGRFLVYNSASVQFTGVGSEAAALGKTVFDLFPSDMARVYSDVDRQVLESGKAILDFEEPTQDSSGEQRCFLTTKIPLRDNSGTVIALLGISQDITERKRSELLIRGAMEREQALRIQAQQSEDRFRTLVIRSLVGIYVIQDGKFAYANPMMEKILGYSGAELSALPVIETVAPEDRDLVRSNIQRRMEGHISDVRYSFRLVRKDGTVAFVEVSGSRCEFNGQTAILGTLVDVTERKEAERKIQRLNEELERRVLQRTAQLEEANKELEAFSYSVSHDLRAPLRHIHGYGELLKREINGQVSGDAQRFLDVISRASEEMGQLIDDLLAFSRMARVELQERPVNLDDLVGETIKGLEMATTGRKIEWNIQPLPKVMGDSSTLKQVFANLLGNAVKYTRHRECATIDIGCHRQNADELVFFVRDNGAGFDMQYADKLFGVFQRLHSTDEFEGTGIGLATVRRVIQRHGGRTWAEAVPDQGATFYFSLKPVETITPFPNP